MDKMYYRPQMLETASYLSDLRALYRIYMHMHWIVIFSGNCFGGSCVLSVFTETIVYKKKLNRLLLKHFLEE